MIQLHYLTWDGHFYCLYGVCGYLRRGGIEMKDYWRFSDGDPGALRYRLRQISKLIIELDYHVEHDTPCHDYDKLLAKIKKISEVIPID